MVFYICLLLFNLVLSVNGYNVTVYSLYGWEERSQKLEISINDSCVSIPDWFLAFDDGVSGFNTQGSCVVAYSLANCQGHHIIMKPGTLEHSNLMVLGFDNLPQSVSPCRIRRIEKEVTIESHDYLPLAFIICTLITLTNAGVYFNHVNRKKKDRRLPRELPRISEREGNVYQAFDLDNFGYERVVNDRPLDENTPLTLELLERTEETENTGDAVADVTPEADPIVK